MSISPGGKRAECKGLDLSSQKPFSRTTKDEITILISFTAFSGCTSSAFYEPQTLALHNVPKGNQIATRLSFSAVNFWYATQVLKRFLYLKGKQTFDLGQTAAFVGLMKATFLSN